MAGRGNDVKGLHRRLMPFKTAVALHQSAEVVISVDSGLVVIRVPEHHFRLWGKPAWARRIAAALLRMADLIDQFGEVADQAVEKR